MAAISEQEEFEFRLRAERESGQLGVGAQTESQSPNIDTREVLKTAAQTAINPLLAQVGMDSQSRQIKETYDRGREGVLNSDIPVFGKGLRENLSDEPALKESILGQAKTGVSMTNPGIGAADLIAQFLSPKEAVKQVQGAGFDLMTGLPLDYAMAKAPAVLGGGALRKLSDTAEKAAGRFLNFYIKPRQAGYSFGRNPGRAVAKYIGPTASRESLLEKIQGKNSELMEKLSEMADSPNASPVDITPVFESIREQMKSMEKLPTTYASQIDSHRAFARDIMNIVKSKGTVKDGKVYLNPKDAIEVKRAIGKLPSWNMNDPKLGSLTGTSRKSYGALDKEIDRAVPGSAETNADISDLIGAEKGIELGMQREQNKSPISLIDLGVGSLAGMGTGAFAPAAAGIAVSKFLRSAPFNTTAGSLVGKSAQAGKAGARLLESTKRPSIVEALIQKLMPRKAATSEAQRAIGGPSRQLNLSGPIESRALPPGQSMAGEGFQTLSPEQAEMAARDYMSRAQGYYQGQIPSQKALPQGQGFELVPDDQVKRQYLESLIDQYGVPEYAPKRSSIKEADIPKIDRSYKSKGEPKKIEKSLRDLLRRRGIK